MTKRSSGFFGRVLSVVRLYFTDAGQTAASNLAWLTLLTILAQLCGLGAVLLLTAVLGRDQFGIIALALAIHAYLEMLGTVGVKAIVVREGAKHPDQLDTIVTSHISITASASIIVSLITVGMVLLFPVNTPERILLVWIAIGTVPASMNVRPLFDVHHHQPFSAMIQLISECLGLLALVILHVIESLTLPMVGGIMTAKWTLSCVGHYFYYHRAIRPIHLTLSYSSIRGMLHSSWPLMFSRMVGNTPLNSGIFFVRAFHGSADAAIIGLAQQVAKVYMTFMASSNRILRPHIAGPYGLHKSFVKKLAIFAALFRVLFFSGVLMVACFVIIILFDPLYMAAMLPIALLLLGKSIESVVGIANMYAIVVGRETVTLTANLVTVVVFVLGCVAMVPTYSFNGAALMVVAAGLLRSSFILFSVRKPIIENFQ